MLYQLSYCPRWGVQASDVLPVEGFGITLAGAVFR